MKTLLLLTSTLLLLISCKKDPINAVIPEPTPTYHTFDGQIGVNDNSTLVSNDNKLLICGNSGSNISLLKVYKMGLSIWRKDFTAGIGSVASGLTQSGDQDVFIVGSTLRNKNQSKSDVLLIKANSKGDTIWTKAYGGSEDDYGYYILSTEDGNLLLCGISFSYTFDDFCDIYLIKVNMDGDIIWTTTYASQGQELPYHLLQTQNGEFLVTGTIGDPASNRELYLLKLNEGGNQIWDKVIGPATGKWGFSTVETSNGDLVTCGRTTVEGSNQILLIRTDDEGNEIWEKEYGEVYLSEQGNAIQIDEDESFIITGESYEEHSGQRGIVLLKVDQNGDQLFMKEFGHTLIDYGQNVLRDDNGDYIITGQYYGKIFITLTDNNGVFR